MVMIYDNTTLIRISDEKYPVFFPQVRRENPNTQFPYPYNDVGIIDWGYKVVYDSPMPAGDIITEVKPVKDEEGNYHKAYTSRPFNEEELAQNLANFKQAMVTQADDLFQFDLERNVTFTSGDTEKPVTLSNRNFILWRNMINIIEKDSIESIAVRFQDDSFIDMSAEEFSNFYSQMSRKLFVLRQNHWKYIRDVKAVDLIENIPNLPETFMEV